jgi:hypothetical protein
MLRNGHGFSERSLFEQRLMLLRFEPLKNKGVAKPTVPRKVSRLSGHRIDVSEPRALMDFSTPRKFSPLAFLAPLCHTWGWRK